MLLSLKNKIKQSPEAPGVYFFLNEEKEIIYIGKAHNLKKRLLSYLVAKQKKTKDLLNAALYVNWQKTASEIDALIEESLLIKKHRPIYNILLRDDKQYFYVNFTKEDFPKIYLSHQKHQNALGPFTNGTALRQALSVIRKIIPFCTCQTKHQNLCTYAQLGLCPGYCCLSLSHLSSRKLNLFKKDYQKNIRQIKLILSGNVDNLINRLRQEMEDLSLKEEFERAAVYQTKINALKNIFLHKHIVKVKKTSRTIKIINPNLLKKILSSNCLPERIESYDISNLSSTEGAGSVVVFGLEKESACYFPIKASYRIFHIKNPPRKDDTGMLEEVIQRRLKHSVVGDKPLSQKNVWPIPDMIFLDGGKGQLKTALRVLEKEKLFAKLLFEKRLIIVSLAKRQEKLYTISWCSNHQANSQVFVIKDYYLNSLPQDIANFFKIMRNEAHRFAIKHHRIIRKKMRLTKL